MYFVLYIEYALILCSCPRNPTAFRLSLLHALVKHEVITPSNATSINNDWSEDAKPPAPLLLEMSDSLLPLQVGGGPLSNNCSLNLVYSRILLMD